MKRIILFLFFLALGLLSISCGKISIGGSSDNKNADDLQTNDGTNAPKPTSVPFTAAEYAAFEGYYKGIFGGTISIFYFKKDKTYAPYNCGLDDGTLTENGSGTYEGFDHTGIYMKSGGNAILFQWDGKDGLKGDVLFTRTPYASLCPGSAGLTSKGKDYETLEGFWKDLGGGSIRFYFVRDGQVKAYYCANGLSIQGITAYTINGKQVSGRIYGQNRTFAWDDKGTPTNGADDALNEQGGDSFRLVKLPAGADACS